MSFNVGDRVRVLAVNSRHYLSQGTVTRAVSGDRFEVALDGVSGSWFFNAHELQKIANPEQKIRMNTFPPRYVVKDSGEREEWDTGSRRDTREGKGRYDLLPPEGIRRLAKVYEAGAAKYDDRNWEKGQPLSRFLDSACRHLFAVLEGKQDEDHAAQAAWNLLGFITISERIETGALPRTLDDLGWCKSADTE